MACAGLTEGAKQLLVAAGHAMYCCCHWGRLPGPQLPAYACEHCAPAPVRSGPSCTCQPPHCPSAGTFRTNTEIARDVATRAPYAEWVKSCARKLSEMNASM